MKPVIYTLASGHKLIIDADRPHLEINPFFLDGLARSEMVDRERYVMEEFRRMCAHEVHAATIARAKPDEATREREAICEFIVTEARRGAPMSFCGDALVTMIRDHLIHHRKQGVT